MEGKFVFRARVCPVYLNRASAADSSIEHIAMEYSWAELGNVVVYKHIAVAFYEMVLNCTFFHHEFVNVDDLEKK